MSYRRSQERNRKLKKLYNETKNSYGVGVYYNVDKGRYIKYSPRRKSRRTMFLHRVANRKVRRCQDYLKNGLYRKIYDYWWELF